MYNQGYFGSLSKTTTTNSSSSTTSTTPTMDVSPTSWYLYASQTTQSSIDPEKISIIEHELQKIQDTLLVNGVGGSGGGGIVDLSIYATKAEVPSLVLPPPDLSAYAKKVDIPPTPDLTPYAMKTDIPAAQDLTPYAMKTDIPNPPDLSPYAFKTDIPPAQDLTPYALKKDIPPAQDLTTYARTSDLAVYALKADVPNTSSLVTKKLLPVIPNSYWIEGYENVFDGTTLESTAFVGQPPGWTQSGATIIRTRYSGGILFINVDPGTDQKACLWVGTGFNITLTNPLQVTPGAKYIFWIRTDNRVGYPLVQTLVHDGANTTTLTSMRHYFAVTPTGTGAGNEWRDVSLFFTAPTSGLVRFSVICNSNYASGAANNQFFLSRCWLELDEQ